MKRKAFSPAVKVAAIARLNEVIRKFCENVEQRPEEARPHAGVLAQLDEQPREA